MKSNIINSKLCKYIPPAFFYCVLFLLPISFVYEKGAREIFYISSYLAIAGLAINWINQRFFFGYRPALTFILLGVMFIIWSMYSNAIDNTNKELLYTAGKRCFLASFIIAYSYHLSVSDCKSIYNLKTLTIVSITIAFCVSSMYALYQMIIEYRVEDWRLELGINRATLTAYAYSALTIALVESVLNIKSALNKSVAFLFVAATSIYVIILTETRSAMIIHSFFLIYYALKISRSTNKKQIISAFFLIIIAFTVLSHKTIEKRFLLTIHEVSSFIEGDDRSSLGSRFTMWESGVKSILQAPFGQSIGERNLFIKAFLYSKNENNSSAFDYIDVHLHNEFIQYASTFGIVGVSFLLYFYWVNIVTVMRVGIENRAISLVTISVLLYGLTDVLLTSIEYIVILSTLVSILTMGKQLNVKK